MSLWTNQDNDLGKPKSVKQEDKQFVYGVDTTEASISSAKAKGAAHAGWVSVKEGTGGRAGRFQTEVLVAMGSMALDAEDTVFPDAATILAFLSQPASVSVMAPESATFTASVSVTPINAPVVYSWEVDEGLGFSPITNELMYSGFNTPTLTVLNSTGKNGYIYRLVVSSAGVNSITSNTATLTVTLV